jgi:hypothetical protein
MTVIFALLPSSRNLLMFDFELKVMLVCLWPYQLLSAVSESAFWPPVAALCDVVFAYPIRQTGGFAVGDTTRSNAGFPQE